MNNKQKKFSVSADEIETYHGLGIKEAPDFIRLAIKDIIPKLEEIFNKHAGIYKYPVITTTVNKTNSTAKMYISAPKNPVVMVVYMRSNTPFVNVLVRNNGKTIHVERLQAHEYTSPMQ